MKQSKLVLFFTAKSYRWATLEGWKIKFCALPGIKHIISWWYGWKFYKNTKDMSNWERYQAVKRMEHQSQIFVFTCRLISLQACIMAEDEYRNDEEFLKCKQDVLESEYINNGEFDEFKVWVEQITPEERDNTRVQKIIESLMPKKTE